ncbi:MAG: hypothetical protein ACR2O3_10565, partial [Rhizobiaceae bacterium]
MRIFWITSWIILIPAMAVAQNTSYFDSETRHENVGSIALDCSSDYPVTAASAGTNLAVSVWDKSLQIARLDFKQTGSSGPVAVATGHGLAGSPNFKILTASLMPEISPPNLRGRIQLISWGVGNGEIIRLRTRVLEQQRANADELHMAWTSSGLVLGALHTDSDLLDLMSFDVNFITGEIGQPSISTQTEVSDFALDGDPQLPAAVLAMRINDTVTVQSVGYNQPADNRYRIRVPDGFTLPPPDNLNGFDVAVIKEESTGSPE